MVTEQQSLRRPAPWLIAPAAAMVAVVVGVAAGFLGVVVAVGAAGLGVGVLLLTDAHLAVYLTLFVRPLLDMLPAGFGVPGFSKTLDLSALVALMLAGAGALYVVVNRVQILRVPLALPFLATITVAIASLMGSPYPGITTVGIARLLGQFGLYVLVFCSMKTRSHVEKLVLVIALSAIGPCLYGFEQIAFGHARYIRASLANGITDPRLSSPFGWGLTVGVFMVEPLLLWIVLFLEARNRLGRLAYAAVIAFLGVSFYYTLARSAWAGLGLALAILGAVRYRVLWMVGPVVLLLALVLLPDILLRVTPVVTNPQSTTAVGRLARSEGALQVFVTHPILGAGLGVGDVLAGFQASNKSSPAHNDYFRVLADTGVIGFAAYLWLMLAAGIEGWRVYRRLRTPRLKAFALAYVAAWVSLMLMRATGNVFTHQVFQYNFWALAAGVLVLPAIESAEEKETVREGTALSGPSAPC